MSNDSPLVVYFHSVAPVIYTDWSLRFLTMELDRFEAQLNYIVERSYKAVFLDEWWSIRSAEAPYTGKEICVTFDDGLLDNWVYAYPLIKKHGLKMTVFVCPELIEKSDRVRQTLEDVWAGKCGEQDLIGLGHLSWGELRAMQASGHVDIQSHTMSHAKYIVSDELRATYYGGFEGHYPIMNTYPGSDKPFYANDPGYYDRIELGKPLFAETSSVVAQCVSINDAFYSDARSLARDHDLADAHERKEYEVRLGDLHAAYRGKGELVIAEESFSDHVDRVEYELFRSKQVLEAELDKPVQFLCWPHGDNSLATHSVAKEAGYLATTVGKLGSQSRQRDRIPRIGTDWPMDPWRVHLKFKYKMESHLGHEPYHTIAMLNEMKNKFMGRS